MNRNVVGRASVAIVVLLLAASSAPALTSGESGGALRAPALPWQRLPGQTCSQASPEIGTLPFTEARDTTGWGDDYNLGSEPALCAGGGIQYLSTGLGDDIVFLIGTDIGCELEVVMDPTGSDDLALYVLSPDCSDVDGNCVRVSDGGGTGTTEVVTFTAVAQQPYYVIVDGFNGDNGPFDLVISERSATGCRLTDLPGALGNWVWDDANSDGLQTSGEQGIPYVTVNLYSCAGGFVTSTTSLAGGTYQFSELSAADYFVEFILPQDYAFGLQDQGADDAADSDADPTTGRTVCTTLDVGEEDLTWDAGMVWVGPKFNLGDRVWDDKDWDGIQDPGEPGVQGVYVDLVKDTGTPLCQGLVLANDTTDASGNYRFDNLDADTYCLVVYNIPGNYTFSPQDQGGEDWLDSDADQNGHIRNIVLSGNDMNQDCGIHNFVLDKKVYLPVVFRAYP
jgi:hypothetical protein